MINYIENEHFDFNLELCLSEFFPIQRKKFETEIEIFQYLFDIEVACKQKFEIIFKNFEKISKKDKENAKYILYEKLMISFEQIKQAESIIEAINRSYNETDYINDSHKLASSGYSYLLPALAMDLNQKDLIDIKDLENNILELRDKLIPLSTSYTESAGAPEKAEGEKSDKTLKNESATDNGGGINNG